ncbi:MAG: mandelate racemase [Acidobacteriaceae bacterium]|nr:mandelate racemase [Acidobacteriaceae bacterium]
MAARSCETTISSGRISAFRIPTEQPESDGTATWDATTVLLVELSAAGVTGIGFAYTNAAAAPAAQELTQKIVLGRDAFDIPAVHSALDAEVRNWGRPGLVSTAISAIDNCLWDLKARLLDRSLLALLGKAREHIPAYGSGGFTSYTEKQLIDQLAGWAASGLRFVKMKIGRDPDRDVERVSAASKALKRQAELYVDANGAYRRKQALKKAHEFADLGVTWFEEPVTSDDRIGLHMLVERAPAVMDIAAGEYCYVLDDARLLIEAEAVDVLQADATRCGGVTNFLKIGHVAETYHVPLSAHTSPSLHATLCCALPSAMNVEYFYDHSRIEQMIFEGALQPRNGNLKPDLSRPGFGLELKRSDAEKFQIFWASVN